MEQYGDLMAGARNAIAKKALQNDAIMSEEVDIDLSPDTGPKNWAGGGGYSYELIAPGQIKVTGSDTSKTLQGGQSAVVTDPSIVRHILSERDSGDPAVSKGMMQKDRALYNQSELKDMMQREDIDLSQSGMAAPGGIQEVGPLERIQTNIREAMDEAMSMGDKAGFQKLSSMLAGMMGK